MKPARFDKLPHFTLPQISIFLSALLIAALLIAAPLILPGRATVLAEPMANTPAEQGAQIQPTHPKLKPSPAHRIAPRQMSRHGASPDF
jgi:hypothetical protein